jgi:DivIVA domain-containing protein
VRFPLALRGYRMSDVDALLARLATELEDHADARAQELPDDRPATRPKHRSGDEVSGDAEPV